MSKTFSIKRGRPEMKSQRGLTMVEILVTVVVIAVGLLGVASLTVGSLKNNQSAFLRTQAMMLASDMADRMKSNAGEAVRGTYSGFDTSQNVAAPNCAAGCSASDLADLDKFEWKQQVEGQNGSMAMLPGGTGAIAGGGVANGLNTFTITVTWQSEQWGDNQGEMQLANQQAVLQFSL